MPNSPETDDVVEVTACCEACAKTFEMVHDMYGMFQVFKSSPMMAMAQPSAMSLPSGFILPSANGR